MSHSEGAVFADFVYRKDHCDMMVKTSWKKVEMPYLLHTPAMSAMVMKKPVHVIFSIISGNMANGTVKISEQSGVLPIAGDMIVLITARSSGRWIIPKGYIEKGMSPAESAAKEAWEEAGVTGTVRHEEIGAYSYRRPSGIFSVTVYPLEVDSVLDRWDEMHVRQRRLVTPSEALELIGHKELKNLVTDYIVNRFDL
jgi:8-oxo-dGTP pyrophosphatase MutT (NUDIX family)